MLAWKAFSVTKIPLRAPFTLLTLAALVLRAWRTDTLEHALPPHVIARAGFAPEDLFEFAWHRLFSSALFTHGPLEFWTAVLMIVFAVGLIERLAGSVIAGLTFWGVHLVTLVAESLFVALPLKLAGVHIGAQIASVRDVGPSAGYVGALGLLCALLPKPWRYVAAGVTLSVLLYVIFAPDQENIGIAAQVSAGVAHLIAYPLGWWSLALWRRLRRRGMESDAAAPCSESPAVTRVAPASTERSTPIPASIIRAGETAAHQALAATSATRFRARSSS